MELESSRGELQLWFKPRPNPNWEREVMVAQSPGSPNLGSPGKKSHLDVAFARSYRKYYKGEGGGFPRVQAVVCHVSPS
jgi:hypothetical protein